jgi:hypothetical protein
VDEKSSRIVDDEHLRALLAVRAVYRAAIR